MLFTFDAGARRLRVTALAACCAAVLATYLPPAVAQTTPTAPTAAPASPPTYPSAAATDPNTIGWMRGFPPPQDKLIEFNAQSLTFPRTRWSFSHIRQLQPTVAVWRGAGAPSKLPRAERDLDGVTFTDASGARHTFADMLALTYTDGILVMHKGRVVYERYFGALDDHTPHIAMSVTKSFVGTLAAILADEGKLDPSAPVTRYVPELANSAYGDATVRDVMDMTVGVAYSENYADPNAQIWDYARAGGLIPRPPGYGGPKNFYAFLETLRKEGEHGQVFAYKTVNAEVLAWILRRATGEPLAKLMSERLWQPIGAEADAYFEVDGIGTESGGGGLNTTLRDLARFGETMRRNGRFNGRQIVPAAVVADIHRGGDPAKFAKAGFTTLPGWSYRDMWWVSNDDHGVIEARGIYGQAIYVDPKAEMTIVRYASHPIAANGANDGVTLPAFRAVALDLMQHDGGGAK
jgi:CubicO group peptidase (beta-lactamase class C family)